ncbi:hypothetical protein NZNM25_15040 [Nitrosopumilus zosterae]|uniref:Uncharacterized protein n=1 Tax=Nitrosopumilus zosterae TaxID=718286 RepID=A0A2S2KST7_9ARCH|nr:hypothetical protein [Nitrosopumilus zosterae]BDQ30674.1 hypothetical protein NZOSNM25_000780 [Nitrosopumilus zosterae]GBH34713.1 hypothetical protein NZNM25_15040 [Nitrosopumilus zosterae]
MNHGYFEKSLKKVTNKIKFDGKNGFQKFFIHASFIVILIIATTTMAIADESILTQSFSNSEFIENSAVTPRGHIEDFSWTKRVSPDGVIEISGIGFSVINDDDIGHSFEICTIVQGPLEKFTPSLDSPLACTNTEKIEPYGKIENQFIDFSNGVKVSELVDISIAIQELDK